MKKKTAWLTCGAVLALAACVVFLGVSCRQPTTLYLSVKSTDFKDKFWENELLQFDPPAFAIRDGKLYLRFQTSYNWIFLMGGHVDDWDADKIAAFRRAHPELEEYWPDKEREDGGVKWLRK